MEEVRALTPLFFQEALAEEIRWLTKDMRFRHPKNREFIPLRAHTQALPIPEKKKDKPADIDGLHYMDSTIDYINDVDEDAVFDCPWCLVKMNGGKIPGINQRQEISVAICFGIFDNSPENKGHQTILNLIQKTYERFAKNPLLQGQYTCQGNFEWALQEEDTFPYFFGAISMQFSFWGFRRESKFI